MFNPLTPDMIPTLIPDMIPASARKAMVEQGRRVLAAQGELLSWQFGRIEAAEEQTQAFWKLSLDQTRKAVDNAIAMQEQAMAALAPKDSAKDDDATST